MIDQQIMKPYFAYGSNMWNDQMNRRCPQNKKIGIARLPGYRWIISNRGYANVVKSEEHTVEGVLFEISDTDEAALDGYEGVASGSYAKAEIQVLSGDKSLPALVYVDPVTTEGTPPAEYVQRINAALADAGLTAEYVDGQVRKFIPE